MVERKNPAPSRREIEISKVIREALIPAVIVEDYPRTAIEVWVGKCSSLTAGSRCAGITAASLALADAGINMRDLVVGCSCGLIEDQVVADLDDTEDKDGTGYASCHNAEPQPGDTAPGRREVHQGEVPELRSSPSRRDREKGRCSPRVLAAKRPAPVGGIGCR